jgi:hypothetical protein
MLKKTLIVAAALAVLALGATSPASAHDRDDRWDGGKNWKNYSYGYDHYRHIQKPHPKKYQLLEVPALSLVVPVPVAAPLVLATRTPRSAACSSP